MGQFDPAGKAFYSQMSLRSHWLAASPKAPLLVPVACGEVSLQNSSKTSTKKQYLGEGERGEEEEQKACAFMPIVSPVQECTLLGMPGGRSCD